MNSPLPFVPTGCKNLSGMTAPVGYWVALLTVLCGLVYLGLKYRALRASAGDLSTALSRRETELLEARESLHRIAAIDPITSLANHSAFQEFLQAEWRRALREASCISVLLVDIDYFRDYNDRLGHQAGDECLARIGSTFKGIVQRPGDLVARYGGGEFAVVMSRTDPQGASLVAHRICAAVEALAMKHPRVGGLTPRDGQRRCVDLHARRRFTLGRVGTRGRSEQSPHASQRGRPKPNLRHRGRPGRSERDVVQPIGENSVGCVRTPGRSPNVAGEAFVWQDARREQPGRL